MLARASAMYTCSGSVEAHASSMPCRHSSYASPENTSRLRGSSATDSAGWASAPASIEARQCERFLITAVSLHAAQQLGHMQSTCAVGPLAREPDDCWSAQRHNADARVVQRPVLVRHYALPWQVRIQEHMVGQLMRSAKGACVSLQAMQERLQPAARYHILL